jgi:ATP-dependent Clp protease adaptor protein ClpS
VRGPISQAQLAAQAGIGSLGVAQAAAMIEEIALKMSDDRDGSDGDEGEGRTGIVTKTRPKTKKPSLYKVLLLNDDYTPMEFVVHVLEKYFNKGREDATRIMLHVHHKGVGICGVYTYEVAETKVTQVIDFARQHGHPLQCTMEKE